MKPMLLAIVTGLVLFCTPALAGDIREVQVKFSPGTTGTTIKDSLKGYLTVNYKLRARAGQSMVVVLKSDNGSTYFNIFAPGKGPGDEALFIGAMRGYRFEGPLPADGEYTIQVFLMRNAARRNETAHYALEIRIH